MKNNKFLKTAMVSAVAFTPVLAVGVNVEKASAATDVLPSNVESFLVQLDVVYADARLADGLPKLHAAQDYLAAKSDWDAVAKKMLNKNTLTTEEQHVLNYLLPLFAASTTTSLKDAVNNFYKSVTDAELQKAFGVTVGSTTFTKATFTSFLVETESKVFENYSNSTNGSSMFDEFANALLTSTSYPDVKKAITDKFVISRVFDELKTIASVKVIQDAKEPFALVAKIYDEKFGVDSGGVTPTPSPTPPPVTTTPGEVSTGADTVASNPQAVIDAINAAASVEELTLTLTGTNTSVGIPALVLNALKNKNSNASIVLTSGTASYSLPVSFIDASAAATALGVASSELKLEISMAPVANPLANNAAYTTLSGAIDFKVAFVAPNGEKVEINVFPKPVTRSITTDTVLDPSTTVGVTVDAQGNVKAVPTFVVASNKEANLHRSGNSVYTLIKNSKT